MADVVDEHGALGGQLLGILLGSQSTAPAPVIRRTTNEDAFVVASVFEGATAEADRVAKFDDAPAVLLAVSDGIGGAAAGEVASALVIESLVPRTLGKRELRLFARVVLGISGEPEVLDVHASSASKSARYAPSG